MKDNIFEYCRNTYVSVYDESFVDYQNRHGDTRKAVEEAERFAQKQAIRIALTKGVTKFPNENVANIWKNVYKVHIRKKICFQES